MAFEFMILDFIQTHMRNAFLDTLMPFITRLGNGGVIWIILTIVLLLFPKTRRTGVILAVSLGLESLFCNVFLKPLVARIRPFEVNTAVQLLIAPPSDFSFPSGHTGISFAAAAALYFGKNKLWIPALILAVIMAFSRLYLYVHYPTDVLAGAVLGIVSGWLGYMLINALWKRKQGGKIDHICCGR